MLRFTLRRILESLPLLFLLSLLFFALFQFIPGDYLTEMELNPSIPPERVEQLRKEYGLDDNLATRYFKWAAQLLQGNLGYSFAQRRPAVELIMERLTGTLKLTVAALFLTLVLAIPPGVISALRVGEWPDRLSRSVSLIGLSIPVVLSSVIFLYLAFRTGWFPIGGQEGWLALVLPALTLALPSSAFLARTLRLELIDTLNQPFVIVLISRGLPQRRVLYHALRNAANPLISLTGLTVGGLLSGSVVVEKVFRWPGLGSLIVDSILTRDLFVALNAVLLAALLMIASNLVSDLLLALNDPRIRYR